jgi:phosphoesterase RecJ-like protein
MIKNNSFQEIWDKLKTCKKALITLHYGPDGDSLGSCAAMKYVLERDFKTKVDLISYDSLSDLLGDLPYKKEIQFGKDISEMKLEDYDVTLILDMASPDFASGKLKKEFVLNKNIFSVRIDHHHVTDDFTTMKYVDSTAPSACSVLIELFKDVNIKFDKELSTRLLLGLCTDSGFFTIDANPVRALTEALFLINHSGDYSFILKLTSNNKSLKSQKYRALVLTNLKMNKEKKLGYSLIQYQDVVKLGLNEAEIRDAPGAIQSIKEFDFIFTLTEMKDYVKGSFRSAKGVDVSLFAKELGGHGHKAASGFFLPNISLEEAEKKVLAVIEKVGINKS